MAAYLALFGSVSLMLKICSHLFVFGLINILLLVIYATASLNYITNKSYDLLNTFVVKRGHNKRNLLKVLFTI